MSTEQRIEAAYARNPELDTPTHRQIVEAEIAEIPPRGIPRRKALEYLAVMFGVAPVFAALTACAGSGGEVQPSSTPEPTVSASPTEPSGSGEELVDARTLEATAEPEQPEVKPTALPELPHRVAYLPQTGASLFEQVPAVNFTPTAEVEFTGPAAELWWQMGDREGEIGDSQVVDMLKKPREFSLISVNEEGQMVGGYILAAPRNPETGGVSAEDIVILGFSVEGGWSFPFGAFSSANGVEADSEAWQKLASGQAAEAVGGSQNLIKLTSESGHSTYWARVFGVYFQIDFPQEFADLQQSFPDSILFIVRNGENYRLGVVLASPKGEALAILDATTGEVITFELPAEPTKEAALVETPEPTDTPEPAPTEVVEQQSEAPEIEGLSFENGFYYAEAGNPYGLEAGEEVGYFKPDVTLEGELTGGLVCFPQAGLKILEAELASIEDQMGKWLLPLPMDPRGVNNVALVLKQAYGGRVPSVEISFTGGKVPVSNVVPDSNLIKVIRNMYSGFIYIDARALVEQEFIPPDKLMEQVVVGAGLDGFSGNKSLDIHFGGEIGISGSPVCVSIGLIGQHLKITPDKILSLGGTPVFIAPK